MDANHSNRPNWRQRQVRWILSADLRVVLGTVILAAIFVSWVAWATHGPSIASFFLSGSETAEPGRWGDTFGALNTLFAGLAFTGVLATLLLQGSALRGQQKDQHRQRFESSFFELMRLLRELKDDVRFRHSASYRRATKASGLAITKTGPEAIQSAVFEARHWLTAEERSNSLMSKDRIGEIYRTQVHMRYESSLGPYFRVIYTVLNRIREDAVLTEKEKHRYGNLLRSQLTSHEVSLCALNGLTPISKDFASLVTEFRLLKYHPPGSMRRRLERYYPPEAFAPRD